MKLNNDQCQAIWRLLHHHRWAALATISPQGPYASMVAFAAMPHFDGFVLFLSQLAAHTRNVLHDARVSLVVSEPDTGEGDPQQLARLSIEGVINVVPREEADLFDACRRAYAARFPTVDQWLSLQDFSFYILTPRRSRYVGGFGQIISLDGEALKTCWFAD